MFRSVSLAKDDLEMIFPLSKQCVIVQDAEEAGLSQMQRLNFSEYLEYFARVAQLQYYGSEMHEIPLNKKVQNLMDDLFEQHDMVRTQIEEHQIAYEGSDDEY